MKQTAGMIQEDALRGILRHAKLRVTDVRLMTLRVMQGAHEALDAAAIFERLQKQAKGIKHGDAVIDRVTVYRTLNSFVEKGIAHKVDPGDRIFRFSLTDHAHCSEHKHDHEHPHLLCDSCGTVQCLPDAEITLKSKTGAKQRTPSVRQQDVTLHGTCEKCDGKAG